MLPQISFAALTKPNCTIATTLKQGSKGEEVKRLQNFLAARYFLKATDIVTGTFGPTTQWYVVKYQQEKSIPAIGTVGPTTRAAIEKDCGKPKNGNAPSYSNSNTDSGLWGGYTPGGSDEQGASGLYNTGGAPVSCPQVTIPECPGGYLIHQGIDSNFCDRGYVCGQLPQYYYMRTDTAAGAGLTASTLEGASALFSSLQFMGQAVEALIFGR